MNDSTTPHITDAQQTFLNKLRSSTAQMHQQLEDTALSRSLLDNDLSVEQYANYLLHMRSVIAFCELQIFPILRSVFPDLEQRHKLAAIEDDIQTLSKQVGLPAVPVYVAHVDENDIPFAAGFMYVIEGSTLGGRVLLKHVKDTLGFDESNAARFFAGYGAATGSLWKAFMDNLSNYSIAADENRIIAGANYAFSSIREYFG